MFIVSTGFGFITPLLLVLLYFGLPYIFGSELPDKIAITLLLSGIANWFIGSYFNNKKRPESTELPRALKVLSKHTLFFIDMKWWSIPLILASIYFYLQ